MPLGCSIVVFSTHLITSEKISGDKIHPCLTPILSADKSELWITLHLFFLIARSYLLSS